MAFTRFHDDPVRIQKYLEETTNVGNYELNVPGNGDRPYFVDDPHVRMQKWGANLSQNATDLDSDLRGLTRKLNRDTIKENNFVDYLNTNNLYYQNSYPTKSGEVTEQPRVIMPAWTVRETDSHSQNIPNNFKYLHMDPQAHVCLPFSNNISSRIVEKDYYSLRN